MTKSTIVRFDDAILPDKITSKDDIMPLIEYLNATIDNLIRITAKGTGFNDNLDADVREITVTSGTATKTVTRKRPIGVIPLKANKTYTTFYWEILASNEISLTVNSSTPGDSLTVTLAIVYS